MARVLCVSPFPSSALIMKWRDVCNSITYLKRTLMFDWCAVWCGSKNGYKKACVFEETGLQMLIIVNVIGRAYMTI